MVRANKVLIARVDGEWAQGPGVSVPGIALLSGGPRLAVGCGNRFGFRGPALAQEDG
jgi:hypothetical protein